MPRAAQRTNEQQNHHAFYAVIYVEISDEIPCRFMQASCLKYLLVLHRDWTIFRHLGKVINHHY